MLAQYLKFKDSSALSPQLKARLTKARTVDDVTPVWARIFSKYFDSSEYYLYSHMIKRDRRVPGHKFPAVTYIDKQSRDEPNRRVMLVEAMNLQGATWDAKASDIYSVLRGLDSTHGARKALGVLSAGRQFVLFEVTGMQEPKYLIGSPKAPADLLDEATSLSLEKQINGIKATVRAGGCKAFVPPPVSATVVAGSGGKAISLKPGSPAPASRSGTPPASGSNSPVLRGGTTPATRANSPAPRVASPVKPGVVTITGNAATRKK